jgi:hypothetical protein
MISWTIVLKSTNNAQWMRKRASSRILPKVRDHIAVVVFLRKLCQISRENSVCEIFSPLTSPDFISGSTWHESSYFIRVAKERQEHWCNKSLFCFEPKNAFTMFIKQPVRRISTLLKKVDPNNQILHWNYIGPGCWENKPIKIRK